MKITNWVKSDIWVIKEGDEIIICGRKPKEECIKLKFGMSALLEDLKKLEILDNLKNENKI